MDTQATIDEPVIDIDPNTVHKTEAPRRPLPWPVAAAIAILASVVVTVAVSGFATKAPAAPVPVPVVQQHLVVVTNGKISNTYNMPTGSQVITDSPTGDCSITIDGRLIIAVSGADNDQICTATVGER